MKLSGVRLLFVLLALGALPLAVRAQPAEMDANKAGVAADNDEAIATARDALADQGRLPWYDRGCAAT
jgi:hypothetical protein